MGAGLNNSDDHGPMAEINITPFVDVMLVLLVIFMVAAPLMETGIPIDLPKAKAKSLPRDKESPITLNLTKDSKIFLGKREIFLSQMRGVLQTAFKDRQNKQIYIRADGALPYAFVARTMASVKLAGINKIGLVTLPPEPAKK